MTHPDIQKLIELGPELKTELSNAKWRGKNAARFFDRGEANGKIPRLETILSAITALKANTRAMIAAASPSPRKVPTSHVTLIGERLSAPDLAHRFVAETYDYQPQDPMARYLRERFTEYIEIDRAMAREIMLSDEVVLSAAMKLYQACQKHEAAILAMNPSPGKVDDEVKP